MINIKIIKKEKMFRILEIYGHSKYAEYGKDIVCSAISGIVQGMFNAISKMCNKNNVDIKLDPNNDIQAKIVVKNYNDKKLQLLITALYYQLLTVQIQFSEFISIKEV